MAIVEGVVEKTSEQKSPPGKRAWTKKGMLIDGAWYNCFVNHENKALMDSIYPGTVVKIETKQDGAYTNVVSVEVMSQQAVANSPAATASVATASDKDYRITYLASRRDAIEFVFKLLAMDLLPLPAKKDKVDSIIGFIDEYASQFAATAMGAKLVTTEEEDNNNDNRATGME